MTVMLQDGYAEVAPQEKTSRKWYLPHFAVTNPNKPDNTMNVQDDATRATLHDFSLTTDGAEDLISCLLESRREKVT